MAIAEELGRMSPLVALGCEAGRWWGPGGGWSHCDCECDARRPPLMKPQCDHTCCVGGWRPTACTRTCSWQLRPLSPSSPLPHPTYQPRPNRTAMGIIKQHSNPTIPDLPKKTSHGISIYFFHPKAGKKQLTCKQFCWAYVAHACQHLVGWFPAGVGHVTMPQWLWHVVASLSCDVSLI